MSNFRRTGFREDLIYSATPPPRRVWTRSALRTVKLFRAISASSTDGVSHVSIKAMIDGSLEDINKLISTIENRRLLQDRGILSRIFETAATVRRQVGGVAGT